jgi:hypothetical protein
MRKENIYKIILLIVLCILLASIINIVNKEGKIVDFWSSVMAVLGSVIGIVLSVGIRKLYNKTNKNFIYITYNINDTEFANKLINNLKSDGYNIVKENDIITIGETLTKDKEDEIKKSKLFLVIVSSNMYKSKLLKDEILIAKKNNIAIIPVLKDDVEIPSFLNNYKLSDFRNNYEIAYKNLTQSI